MLEQLELPPSARWTYTIGNYNVSILSLERGMFEINHSELNHTAVYSGQRNSLAIVNSVVWCDQTESVCECFSMCEEDYWRYESRNPTHANFPKIQFDGSKNLPQVKTLKRTHWTGGNYADTTQTRDNEERNTVLYIKYIVSLSYQELEDSYEFHLSVFCKTGPRSV